MCIVKVVVVRYLLDEKLNYNYNSKILNELG